jgi:signal transduction histidine kinase
MRRVIGMLDTALPPDPQPGAGNEDLERLVAIYRGVGLPVSVEVEGDLPSHTGIHNTVYRVTQEALTNVLRHSSAPTEVTVRMSAVDAISLTITNDGALAERVSDDRVGRGLIGMKERAALYGGTLAAGPDGEGRWVVSMTLPQVPR